MKTFLSRVPPALQLQQVLRAATGRQMRRNHNGAIIIKSAVVGVWLITPRTISHSSCSARFEKAY
nr:hypothetical protein [Rhizobium sp. P28RR-XV]